MQQKADIAAEAAKAEASRGVNSMPGAENRNNLAP